MRTNDPNVVRIASIIFALVGVAFIGIATFMQASENSTKSRLTDVTVGELVDEGSYFNEDGDKMYSPTYSFVVKHQTFECHASGASSTEPNTTTEVKYNPDDIKECRTSYDENVSFFLTIVFYGLGGVLTIIAIALFISLFRKS
jgi:hypothetical protein